MTKPDWGGLGGAEKQGSGGQVRLDTHWNSLGRERKKRLGAIAVRRPMVKLSFFPLRWKKFSIDYF